MASRTKERFTFPLICEDVPRFETQHEAAVFIEEYQAAGHLKRCAYIRLGAIDSELERPAYTPKCDKESFAIIEEAYDKKAFYGCPKDCRLYRPTWLGSSQKWFKDHWWPFR